MQPKPQSMTTRIGRFDVPVKKFRKVRVVFFTGGEIKADAGLYAFWTAVFKKPVGKRSTIIGRARVGLSAGDRFDRMKRESRADYISPEDRKVYAAFWQMMEGGGNVKFVRPSTEREVNKWFKTHPIQEEHSREVVANDYYARM